MDFSFFKSKIVYASEKSGVPQSGNLSRPDCRLCMTDFNEGGLFDTPFTTPPPKKNPEQLQKGPS